MKNVFNQFETDVFRNLDQNNFNKIVDFLSSEAPDYLEYILRNYLDLFLIRYEDFLKKYNCLKDRYGINFLDLDISLLEQFYVI